MGGGPVDGARKDQLLCVTQWSEPKDVIERLKKRFPDMDITYVCLRTDEQPLYEREILSSVPKELYRDATILMTSGWSGLPPSPSDIPLVDFIHFSSAGINHVMKHPIYTDSCVPLTTSSGIHGPQIAEWVIMTALVQSHKYPQLYELQKKHQWGKKSVSDDYHHVRDQVGQRLGVLGYGSIGRQVARVAKAMGMDVIAYTATPKDTPEKRKDHGFVVPGTGDPDGSIPSAWYSGTDKKSLHHFLSQEIDLLLVSVPLTKDTTGLLSSPEFLAMSPRSRQKLPPRIANIARGKIIDQPALVAALQSGLLGGAALDVADPEPLPPDDPLWDAPNVVITPHVSGLGVTYLERSFQVLEENLSRRERGRKLINVVDRSRGY